jgi:hypothetical protein
MIALFFRSKKKKLKRNRMRSSGWPACCWLAGLRLKSLFDLKAVVAIFLKSGEKEVR